MQILSAAVIWKHANVHSVLKGEIFTDLLFCGPHLVPIFVPDSVTLLVAQPADQFCIRADDGSHVRQAAGEVYSNI